MATRASRGRPAAPHWTDRDIHLAVQLYRSGVGYTEIGRRLGRSKDGVMRKLIKEGFSSRLSDGVRHCTRCGKRLARLNVSDQCYACLGSVLE